jgi:hypothetical protein
MADFTATEPTQVHRVPKCGVYEQGVYRILDEGLVCHGGFVADGKPLVIPTGYGRKGDTLYVHGSMGRPYVPSAGRGRERAHHRHASERTGAGAAFPSPPHDENSSGW